MVNSYNIDAKQSNQTMNRQAITYKLIYNNNHVNGMTNNNYMRNQTIQMNNSRIGNPSWILDKNNKNTLNIYMKNNFEFPDISKLYINEPIFIQKQSKITARAQQDFEVNFEINLKKKYLIIKDISYNCKEITKSLYAKEKLKSLDNTPVKFRSIQYFKVNNTLREKLKQGIKELERNNIFRTLDILEHCLILQALIDIN